MEKSNNKGGILNFQVDGAFITSMAREKYKETNDLSKGVDFLREAIVGFPVDFATEVVLGHKKLVGINEVDLEDDNCIVEPYGIIKTSEPDEVVCGWISPEGEIFGHQSYNNQNDHHVLAIEICKRLNQESMNEEWDLEKLGYLKFQPDKVMAGDLPATMSQKCAVARICNAHNTKMQIGWTNHDMYTGIQIHAMDLVMFNKHLNRPSK